MFLISSLSALISVFSPFWGLIFIFAFGEKYQYNREKYSFYLIFIATIMILALGNFIDIILVSDIIIGVAFSTILYFRLLLREHDYLKAIISVAIINMLYGTLRHLMFGKMFIANITAILDQYTEFLESIVMENSEKLLFVSDLIETLKYIVSNFYPAIWAVTIIFAIYICSLLLSRKLKTKWLHKTVRLPFTLVYLIIVFLVLFLLSSSRIIGINGLLMLAPLLFIQGISILDFFLGNYFKKSKFLLYILVLAVLFNPYLTMLIAAMGLLDMWFNFRKISIREEVNENNFN